MIEDKNLNVPDEFKNIYKVLNKLEQRITSLEKVLASHAKCIGQLREDKVYIETLNGPELREENNHE
jgi:hypothetical protein